MSVYVPYTKTRSDPYRFFRFSANHLPWGSPATLNQTAFAGTYTLSGYKLARWRDIIRSGGNATTTLSVTHVGIRHKPGGMFIYYRYRFNTFVPYKEEYSGDSSYLNFVNMVPIGTHFSSGAVDTLASDRAIRSLYKRLNSAHRQIQGGVILGEIDKTARLLFGTAKQLKQKILTYVTSAGKIRRRKGSQKSKQKELSGRYLEATFGWSPLIHDCEDIAKALGRLVHETDQIRFRAGGEAEIQISQVPSVLDFAGVKALKNEIQSTTVRVIYRGFLRGSPYESGSPSIERIITMSGFDLRSFIPTMWELVPYSFIIDYFTNIGDCLQALSVDTDAVYGLWRTTIKESLRETSINPSWGLTLPGFTGPNPSAPLYQPGSQSMGVRTDGLTENFLLSINRSASSMPLLLPKFTGVDLPWRQFVNMGALILNRSGPRS